MLLNIPNPCCMWLSWRAEGGSEPYKWIFCFRVVCDSPIGELCPYRCTERVYLTCLQERLKTPTPFLTVLGYWMFHCIDFIYLALSAQGGIEELSAVFSTNQKLRLMCCPLDSLHLPPLYSHPSASPPCLFLVSSSCCNVTMNHSQPYVGSASVLCSLQCSLFKHDPLLSAAADELTAPISIFGLFEFESPM